MELKHLGDITKIKGGEIEPVWCITGGSPCQDLSVAGKRAGLKHADLGDGETTRSGLFMEQVRIVKEMREHDRANGRANELVRPRYLVWENVDGARSSNFKDGFGDFGAVLEEIIRVEKPGFTLPRLEGKQRWTKAGCIDFDWGGQVAWRLHDAQFWGVPQRRRRICIVCDYNGHTAADIVAELVGTAGDNSGNKAVADFAGGSAGKVLSESEGLPGYSAESFRAWQGAAHNSEESFGEAVCYSVDGYNSAVDDVAATLGVNCGISTGRNGVMYEAVAIENHPTDSRVKLSEDGKVQTLTSRMGTGGNNVPLLLKIRSGCEGGGKGPLIQENRSARLACNNDQTLFQPKAYGIDRAAFNQGQNAKFGFAVEEEVEPTMVAKGPGAVAAPTYSTSRASFFTDASEEVAYTLMGTDYNGPPIVNDEDETKYIVRRLTPTECERLQGYPDGWTCIGEWVDTKGKKHKEADSHRYKALGNSIALPFWRQMLGRMAKYLPEGATMGSLFDGIGGFPLCWEGIHGKGTARWASEIEEFPIAVTKLRFPEEENHE